VFRDRPGFGSGRGDKGLSWLDLNGVAPILGVHWEFYGHWALSMGIGYGRISWWRFCI
jgi:hypothetical protein